MARKGNTQWHVFKRVEIATPEQAEEQTDGTVAREHHFALREDGCIVRKLVVEHVSLFDTRKVERHDYGWKLYSRKPKPSALEVLKAGGFQSA